ncbi:hypothetical protein GCM10007094_14660 [Pseudovibrio japonicus]|uniref:Putative Flp pilus-assembly TadG-like N-terminal domain-containing protein n=2 Tax=Pseudovibrio japonicus TaxID=366534 RepID=A0ABQ3EBR1_9HYPH|nr:hypothetical protein GCM10007094_14660 [Pseudovibrio japonicus]
MVLLIVFAGMAIDFGMGYNTRRAVNQALDAAVLAAANKLSTEDLTEADVETLIKDYYKANLKNSIAEGITIKDPVVKYELGSDVVSASASIELTNNFLPIINLLTGGGDGENRKLEVGTSSSARFPINHVEVTVIVDVTGSMRSHIGALKRASRSMLDALLPVGTNVQKSRIRVALVPYSEGVRLHASDAQKATFTVSHGSCVHERVRDQAATDVAHDYEDDDGKTDYIGSIFKECPKKAEVVPLTADRSKIEASIGQLEAKGTTAGHTGIAWGWYTISPKWAGFWPTDSAPLPYDTENLRKYAIFMTDGEFNLHYYAEKYEEVDQARASKIEKGENRGPRKAGSNPNGSNYFTGPENIKFAKEVIWKEGSSSGELGTASVRAKDICTNMKAKEITIYSVYYGSGVSAKSVMKDCATSDSTFYHADNESKLIQAFEKIANDIKDIYLSQ